MKNRIPLRPMVICAMLTALSVVLDRFVPIVFTDSLKITLGFIPCLLAAILYGPAGGAAVFGLSDFLGAILFPRGAYFPGFTLTAVLKGILFGLFLHREKPSFFPHVILPSVLADFVLSLGVDTLWITILYGAGSGKTYGAYFVGRIWQTVLLFTLHLVLIPLLGKFAATLKKHVKI